MLGDDKKKSTNGNKANQRKQRNIRLEKLNLFWLAKLCKEAWHIVKFLLETTAVLKHEKMVI